jgi:hypothetical protein
MLSACGKAAMENLLFLVIVAASLFVVDYLAHQRGWSRSRWAVASVILGPLAIALIYLADAAYAVGRMIHPPQPKGLDR